MDCTQELLCYCTLSERFIFMRIGFDTFKIGNDRSMSGVISGRVSTTFTSYYMDMAGVFIIVSHVDYEILCLIILIGRCDGLQEIFNGQVDTENRLSSFLTIRKW